jgi:hypothetical protein
MPGKLQKMIRIPNRHSPNVKIGEMGSWGHEGENLIKNSIF